MPRHRLEIRLSDPDETASLARRLGTALGPGDCLLISGPVGAGKTHFCRHLIRSLQRRPEDVPSPTFTLVQTYDTEAGEVWHADLYRIGSADELEELGLEEAFAEAICLVEWPESLGARAPADALRLDLQPVPGLDSARDATLEWSAEAWDARLRPLAA